MKQSSEEYHVSIEGDDSSMPLERRVSFAARYVLEDRCNLAVIVDDVFVYHKSAYAHTIRTKSFVLTPTQVFSVKASFDKDSNEFKRVEINLEIPRGRRDFQVSIRENRKGERFVTPYLGDMKLPSILVEKGDLYAPEEISRQLKTLVSEGDLGWQEAPIQQLALSDPELDVIQIYIRLMRFETLLRKCMLESMHETYQGNTSNRIRGVLGSELDKIRDRIVAVSDRYALGSPDVDDSNLFEFLGFEHYLILVDNDGIWEKCLKNTFKDKSQTVEGLKVIRDVRNEIAHFRPSVHSKLWAAGSMYMDILEGRIRMTDPAFKRLVEMVRKQAVDA